MDVINRINGNQKIQPPVSLTNKHIISQQEEGKLSPPPPFNVQLTQLGQLFSVVEESGESVRNELKQFQESLFDALQSGNFDVNTLIENASDEIKAIAEEVGIDLKLAVTELSEHVQQMNSQIHQGPPPGGKPHHGPPPPPPDELLSSLSDTDEEEYSGIETDD